MGHEREPILVGPQGKESRSAGMESKDCVNEVGGEAASADIIQRAVCSNRASRTVLQEVRVASILHGWLLFWRLLLLRSSMVGWLAPWAGAPEVGCWLLAVSPAVTLHLEAVRPWVDLFVSDTTGTFC